MKEKKKEELSPSEEEFSEQSARKTGIISYILCVFAALIIWLVIMNATNIPEDAEGTESGEASVASVALLDTL